VAGAVSRLAATGGHVEIVQSRIQQGELISVAAGTLGVNAGGHIDGELQMTGHGVGADRSALGIEKMLQEGVPQATLDRVAPGVKTQDLNNLSARSTSNSRAWQDGEAERQCRRCAGINSLGSEAMLKEKKRRVPSAAPLSMARYFWGRSRFGQIPPLF